MVRTRTDARSTPCATTQCWPPDPLAFSAGCGKASEPRPASMIRPSMNSVSRRMTPASKAVAASRGIVRLPVASRQRGAGFRRRETSARGLVRSTLAASVTWPRRKARANHTSRERPITANTGRASRGGCGRRDDQYDLQDAANLAIDILSVRQAITGSAGLGSLHNTLSQSRPARVPSRPNVRVDVVGIELHGTIGHS